MHDVIVVGAGVGGLASALAVAASGRSVLVVEALPEPGGKLGRVLLPGGVEADTGPSVLTLPHVLADVFARAGMHLEDAIELRRLDLATRYRFPDGTCFDTFGNLDSTLISVEEALGTNAARELSSFLSYARGVWEEAGERFVLAPARRPLSLLAMGLSSPARLFRVDPLRSLQRAVEARVREPHLVDMLLRFATYNGSDARRCPAALSSIAWVELGLGTFGVVGGVYEIARALERAGRSRGVRFRYGARVRRFLVEAGRVRGIELDDGERLLARALIANADVHHVYGSLLAKGRRLPTAALSLSAWTGIVRARRRARPPHEVLFPRRYLSELEDLFDDERVPKEPTVYVCAEERAHLRSGWEAHEPLFVMVNAPAGARDDGSLGERALLRLRQHGLLDEDDTLVWQRGPQDLAACFPDTRGALYGAASSTTTAAFRRLGNRAPDVEGLYLASGSVHPGGGVPLCLASGLFAADALIADEARRGAAA